MKILISSHAFSPSIGGIESVSLNMAMEFRGLGQEVRVITQTPSQDREFDHGLSVLRNPSATQLLDAVRWCDVFWHNNLSVRVMWPLAFARRPLVVTHAGSYCAKPTGLDLAQRVKHGVVNRCTSVAISKYVADSFAGPSVIIPNPYDTEVFRSDLTGQNERNGDLIFAGRLFTEKGADILLRSLSLLQERGVRPRLTIVGSGPERESLESLCVELGIQAQVTFVGPRRGAELAETLRAHKILVVPSRCMEAFGVVALEGIACGCAVIGSGGGGLPEAIGPCGITFQNQDIAGLADAIDQLLANPAKRASLLTHAADHLAAFQARKIASQYLDLFASVLAPTRNSRFPT